MAALPYIQLYVADYLSDTMHLETDEHGAYLLLIMNYWQTGKPIPEKRMQSITKLSNERLTNVKETLREFFNVTDNGFWVHDRIERDLAKVYEKSTKASMAGKKSAIKRWGNDENITNVTETLQRKGNHTDTDTDTKQIQKKNNVEKNSKEITDIFEHWQNVMNHKKMKITDNRIKVIKKALKMGYSSDELKLAITGCSLTPYNMGKNDRGEIYDGIGLILRTEDQIDRFISNAKNPPKQNTSTYQRQTGPSEAEWNNADFMSEPGGDEPPLHIYDCLTYEGQ